LAERLDAFLSIVVYHDSLGDRRYYRDHNHCYLIDGSLMARMKVNSLLQELTVGNLEDPTLLSSGYGSFSEALQARSNYWNIS
jgi:hypothetical protein